MLQYLLYLLAAPAALWLATYFLPLLLVTLKVWRLRDPEASFSPRVPHSPTPPRPRPSAAAARAPYPLPSLSAGA